MVFPVFLHTATICIPHQSEYQESNRGILLKTVFFQKTRTAATKKEYKKEKWENLVFLPD
jgi:hypothetical protein